MLNQNNIDIASDGGRRDSGRAAAAAIVTSPTSKLKIVALLEDLNPERAELCGLLLGLAAFETIIGPAKYKNLRVNWTTDSQTVLEGVSTNLSIWKDKGWVNSKGEPLANRDLWKFVLQYEVNISSKYQRDSVQIKKCHQACDWIISLGPERCKDRFNSFLKTNNHQQKSDSWYLIDGRNIFNNLNKNDLSKIINQAFRDRHS